MSDNRQDSNANDFVPFRELSTEELENLISDSFFEDNIDYKDMREMLYAYSQREGVPTMDVNAEWETFKRDYSCQEHYYLTDDADNTTQTICGTEHKKRNWRRRLARFSLVAASIVILCTVFFTSTALGASFWNSIAQWTRETFRFAEKETPIVVNVELESLHKALAEYGISDMLAPTWIPEGFKLLDLTIAPTPKQTTFYSTFRCDENELTIQIISLQEPSSLDYEKDSEEIVPYKRNGINHYVMTNNSKSKVVWTVEYYECFISGDITEDEAEKIINSIYER